MPMLAVDDDHRGRHHNSHDGHIRQQHVVHSLNAVVYNISSQSFLKQILIYIFILIEIWRDTLIAPPINCQTSLDGYTQIFEEIPTGVLNMQTPKWSQISRRANSFRFQNVPP